MEISGDDILTRQTPEAKWDMTLLLSLVFAPLALFLSARLRRRDRVRVAVPASPRRRIAHVLIHKEEEEHATNDRTPSAAQMRS